MVLRVHRFAQRTATAFDLVAEFFGRKALPLEFGEYQRGDAGNVRAGHRSAGAVGIPAVGIGAVDAPYLRSVILPAAFLVPSGSQDINTFSVLAVPCDRHIAVDGPYAYHILVFGRIENLIRPGVSCSGYHQTALHGPRLHVVDTVSVRIVPSGIGLEIVDTVFGRLVHTGLTDGPATGGNHRPVVGSIGEYVVERYVVGSIIPHHLQRHELYAVVVARTARHAAYADAVSVHGRDGTGHVGAVRPRLQDTARFVVRIVVGHEATAVYVVVVTVVVVILALDTVQLRFVNPHVIRQVGMVPLYAGVYHRHDDLRVSLGTEYLPALEQVDVGTGHHALYRAVVVVMPLLGQVGVIERQFARRHRPACLRSRGHINILGRNNGAAQQFHLINRLYVSHSRKLRDGGFGTGNGYILVDFNIVPAVQAEPAAPFGEPAAVGIYPAYFGRSELGRYLVEPRVARLDFAARKGAYLQRLRLFVQLNPHPTPYGNVVAVMGIIPVFPGGLADAIPGNRFFHARSAKCGHSDNGQISIEFHSQKEL